MSDGSPFLLAAILTLSLLPFHKNYTYSCGPSKPIDPIKRHRKISATALWPRRTIAIYTQILTMAITENNYWIQFLSGQPNQPPSYKSVLILHIGKIVTTPLILRALSGSDWGWLGVSRRISFYFLVPHPMGEVSERLPALTRTWRGKAVTYTWYMRHTRGTWGIHVVHEAYTWYMRHTRGTWDIHVVHETYTWYMRRTRWRQDP